MRNLQNLFIFVCGFLLKCYNVIIMKRKISISDAPILEWDDDHAEESKNYFFAQGKKNFSAFKECQALSIDKCIIFYPRAFSECKEIFNKCEKIYEFKSASTVSPVYLYDKKLLIALCPLGGPASANLLEELHFVGITKFIACGSCGCIVDGVDIDGLFFVPTSAIRDEGLSYHYVPASRFIETNTFVNLALEKSLQKHNQPYITGTTWTIDALYRETPNRTKRRIQEGAIGVEMECASLASVAEYNKFYFGELLYFTDKVDEKNWRWRIYDKISLRTKLLKICIDAILTL